MKTIRITEILEYYDGILTFVDRDPIGGHYVGEVIDGTGDNDRYLVVGVRPERPDELRVGLVDLRMLLLEMPEGEWYITTPEGKVDDPQVLISQSTLLAESGYLPEEGYFLGPDDPPNEGAIRRALERGNTTVLTGLVEQANRSTGEWALLTDQGMKSGKTAPGTPGLDGIQIGKRYRFKYAEGTKLDPLWRDRKTLYIQDIESA